MSNDKRAPGYVSPIPEAAKQGPGPFERMLGNHPDAPNWRPIDAFFAEHDRRQREAKGVLAQKDALVAEAAARSNLDGAATAPIAIQAPLVVGPADPTPHPPLVVAIMGTDHDGHVLVESLEPVIHVGVTTTSPFHVNGERVSIEVYAYPVDEEDVDEIDPRPLWAHVICDTTGLYVIDGSETVRRLQEEVGSEGSPFDEEPPSTGVWYWEGDTFGTEGNDGECDVSLSGRWHRATVAEAARGEKPEQAMLAAHPGPKCRHCHRPLGRLHVDNCGVYIDPTNVRPLIVSAAWCDALASDSGILFDDAPAKKAPAHGVTS